jgi:hypothetical protein
MIYTIYVSKVNRCTVAIIALHKWEYGTQEELHRVGQSIGTGIS